MLDFVKFIAGILVCMHILHNPTKGTALGLFWYREDCGWKV